MQEAIDHRDFNKQCVYIYIYVHTKTHLTQRRTIVERTSPDRYLQTSSRQRRTKDNEFQLDLGKNPFKLRLDRSKRGAFRMRDRVGLCTHIAGLGWPIAVVTQSMLQLKIAEFLCNLLTLSFTSCGKIRLAKRLSTIMFQANTHWYRYEMCRECQTRKTTCELKASRRL